MRVSRGYRAVGIEEVSTGLEVVLLQHEQVAQRGIVGEAAATALLPRRAVHEPSSGHRGGSRRRVAGRRRRRRVARLLLDAHLLRPCRTCSRSSLLTCGPADAAAQHLLLLLLLERVWTQERLLLLLALRLFHA